MAVLKKTVQEKNEKISVLLTELQRLEKTATEITEHSQIQGQIIYKLKEKLKQCEQQLDTVLKQKRTKIFFHV